MVLTARMLLRNLLGLVLGIAAAAVAYLIWAPNALIPSASAAMPKTCLNVNGTDDYGQYTVREASGASNGTRTNVWFPSAAADCQRISSVGVLSPTGNGFWEFGWVLGWSTVDGQFHPEPTMFAVGGNTGGAIVYAKVWDNRTPAGGQMHLLRASDLDANTYWGGWVDGVGGFDPAANLNFAQGNTYVNVERGHPNDAFNSEFRAIQEYGSAWNYTDNLTSFGNDPDWRAVIDANEHHVTLVPR